MKLKKQANTLNLILVANGQTERDSQLRNLNAIAHGHEQRGNGEGRDDRHRFRLLLTGQHTGELLEQDHAADK